MNRMTGERSEKIIIIIKKKEVAACVQNVNEQSGVFSRRPAAASTSDVGFLG